MSNPDDILAKVNGITPKITLKDGEQKEVGSKSSKAVYKIKRTDDHYYCSCPAWRNQGGVPTTARSCKHLKELLGDKYEEARLRMMNPDGATNVGAGKKTAPSNKAPAKKRNIDEEEDAENANEPVKKTRKTASKFENKGKAENDEEQGNDKEDEGASKDPKTVGAPDISHLTDSDAMMAEINGVRPKVFMKDGMSQEVGSMSSSSTYKVKRTNDHYYCSCPAWRNQSGAPINARSCKHLKQLLGDAYEAARLKWFNPDGQHDVSPRKKLSFKKTAKKADGDEDDEEDTLIKTTKKIPDLLLAAKWDLDTGVDPTGWWISEKLDGVRVYYDGESNTFTSRLGNLFTPPAWFLEKLPKDITLDGELFGGRGEFQMTVSVVKTINSPKWKSITFHIFDIPSMGEDPFEARMAQLEKLFDEKKGTHADAQLVIVQQTQVRDREHVLEKLKEIETLGGEGVMLRKAESKYFGGRSNTLLKLKSFYDAEARVEGYAAGKGRLAGNTGALKLVMASGKTFNCGSGMNDKTRKNPPKVGSIVVYRFQELTKDGVPRFPTFVGEAADKSEPKDAEVPEHKREATKDGETA